MNLFINGQPRTFAALADIGALVDALGYAGKRIAIEINGEIVPKSQYGTTPLTDGDRLEIVVAVGGG
jgi:sulfur carrier protein